jgi:hypothetical protein
MSKKDPIAANNTKAEVAFKMLLEHCMTREMD